MVMEQTARIATTAHIRNINRATLSLACFDFLLPFKEPFAVTLTAAGVLFILFIPTFITSSMSIEDI